MHMTVAAERERTLSDMKETLAVKSTHASPEDFFFTVTKACINEKQTD
jgi:hypothetical protein